MMEEIEINPNGWMRYRFGNLLRRCKRIENEGTNRRIEIHEFESNTHAEVVSKLGSESDVLDGAGLPFILERPFACVRTEADLVDIESTAKCELFFQRFEICLKLRSPRQQQRRPRGGQADCANGF